MQILTQKQMTMHGHEVWKVKPACRLWMAVHGYLLEAVSSRKLTPGRAQLSWGNCHLLWS